jgi:hypothetical protein
MENWIENLSNEELEEIFRSQFNFMKYTLSDDRDTVYRNYGMRFKFSDLGKIVVKHGTSYCLSNEDRVDKDTITTKNIYDEYIMYCKFAKGKLYDKDKEKE